MDVAICNTVCWVVSGCFGRVVLCCFVFLLCCVALPFFSSVSWMIVKSCKYMYLVLKVEFGSWVAEICQYFGMAIACTNMQSCLSRLCREIIIQNERGWEKRWERERGERERERERRREKGRKEERWQIYTLSCKSREALFWQRNFTTSRWPCRAAQYSGVSPCWNDACMYQLHARGKVEHDPFPSKCNPSHHMQLSEYLIFLVNGCSMLQ